MYKHNISIMDARPILLKYPLFRKNVLYPITKNFRKLKKIFTKMLKLLSFGRLNMKIGANFVKNNLQYPLGKTVFIFQDAFF